MRNVAKTASRARQTPAIVTIGLLLVVGQARAADAPVPAPENSAPSEEQVRAAEVKARQTEVEYLKAQLELQQLKHLQEAADLKARLQAAQDALESLTPTVSAQGDTEGFIRQWLIAGPIMLDEKVGNHDEASCKEMLDRAYVPADAKPVDAEKVTIDSQDLAWKSIDSTEYSIDLSQLAEAAGKNQENAAYLGIVYVTAEQEVSDVKLAIGSDDDSVWRLNGQEVIRVYEGRAVDKDQNTSEPLTLKAGLNVLAVTVLNGEGPCAAAARFLDKDGSPIKGLTFSAAPPEK